MSLSPRFLVAKRAAIAVLAGCGIAAAAAAPAAHAQLLNGSFESGSFVSGSNPNGDPGAMQLLPGSTAMTGWTTFGNDLAWISNSYIAGFNASDGNFFLDLTGYHDNSSTIHGGVQQTVALTGGSTYRLSFDLGFSSRFPEIPDGIIASANAATQTFFYSGPTSALTNWQRFNFDFTGAASTLIKLQGAPTSSGANIGLDNVTLTQISATGAPEASSVALFLPGIIGLGLAARRRRKQ